MKPLRKAIFPVAGMGTRFLPATKSVPKEMLTVVDRPVIDYAVREAVEAGCDTLIFITGRSKQAIANYFDRSPELEKELEEKTKPKHSKSCATSFPRMSTAFIFAKPSLWAWVTRCIAALHWCIPMNTSRCFCPMI